MDQRIKSKYLFAGLLLTACSMPRQTQVDNVLLHEPHRPQIHFTPPEKWMNDPNGMVYHNGVYHLMYQYYPDSTVWGPMHWGHAVSKDLVQWEHRPIALYPDSLGWIFSGSAVVDKNNSSGFGKDGAVPLVAIFTYHNDRLEKAKRDDYQYQGIAYSLDEGKTWTKYAGNPVIKNPGVRDFRDPKVTWHEESHRWIMALAVQDRIMFYSSANLKDWTKESEFGKEVGAHGGVWECPDLFALEHNGEKIWVLFVSINPGGPNGGSATQYFTGRFDGKTFTPFQADTRWVDYGPDNYAGVTWSNTGSRKIFMGWMSNWQYAQVVPTKRWRSAMTVPRDLAMEQVGERYLLRSMPVPELAALEQKQEVFRNFSPTRFIVPQAKGPLRISISADRLQSFSMQFRNSLGQWVAVGYDSVENRWFLDRTASGNTAFEKDFAKRHTAPRLSNREGFDLDLVIDLASIELFADQGLTVLTGIFFPDEPFTEIRMQAAKGFHINELRFTPLKSIHAAADRPN